MEKTHYRKLRNPNYIGSYELMTGDKPIEMVVTIERAVKEQVQNGDKKEDAMVVYLKGQKPMIVNSTNAKAITSSVGSPYIEDWTNKQITLYVAQIKAFGEMQDALRVRKEPVVISLPEFTVDNPQYEQAIQTILAGNNTLEGIVKALSKVYHISETTKKAISDAVHQRL